VQIVYRVDNQSAASSSIVEPTLTANQKNQVFDGEDTFGHAPLPPPPPPPEPASPPTSPPPQTKKTTKLNLSDIVSARSIKSKYLSDDDMEVLPLFPTTSDNNNTPEPQNNNTIDLSHIVPKTSGFNLQHGQMVTFKCPGTVFTENGKTSEPFSLGKVLEVSGQFIKVHWYRHTFGKYLPLWIGKNHDGRKHSIITRCASECPEGFEPFTNEHSLCKLTSLDVLSLDVILTPEFVLDNHDAKPSTPRSKKIKKPAMVTTPQTKPTSTETDLNTDVDDRQEHKQRGSLLPQPTENPNKPANAGPSIQAQRPQQSPRSPAPVPKQRATPSPASDPDTDTDVAPRSRIHRQPQTNRESGNAPKTRGKPDVVKIEKDNVDRFHLNANLMKCWPNHPDDGQPVVTPKRTEECLTAYLDATGNSALRESPCAVCSELRTQDDLLTKIVYATEECECDEDSNPCNCFPHLGVLGKAETEARRQHYRFCLHLFTIRIFRFFTNLNYRHLYTLRYITICIAILTPIILQPRQRASQWRLPEPQSSGDKRRSLPRSDLHRVQRLSDKNTE
jgi:hypothetical protein